MYLDQTIPNRMGLDVLQWFGKTIATPPQKQSAQVGRLFAMGTIDSQLFATEMLEANLMALEDYPGSSQPWPCQCLVCGALVSPRYYTVVKQGRSGCKFCAAKAASKTRSKLAALAATEKALSMQITPQEPYPGAHSKWSLLCDNCGLRFEKVSHSISQGKGCPDCSRNASKIRTKDNNSVRAREAFQNSRLRPLTDFVSMETPWASQCLVCGLICSPRPSAVIYSGVGCRHCAGKRAATARRIDDSTARHEMVTAGILPDSKILYPGLASPWKGICLKCGLPTNCSLGNIRQGHNGCRRCSMIGSDSAFDFFGPAIFYLISLPDAPIGKVGIAGLKTKRLEAHLREGWVVDSIFELEQGFDAWYLEGAVLSWLRGELGLASVMSAKSMPQGGFTETFSLKGVSMADVAKKATLLLQNRTWSPPEAFLDGTAKAKLRRKCSLSTAEEFCPNTYYSNGYCRKHYSAWKKYGDPLRVVRVKYENKSCMVSVGGDLCGGDVKRKGMCSVHYQRDYEHGDPLFMKRPTPRPLPERCEVSGCVQKPYALGKCQRHYHAHRRSTRVSRERAIKN